MCESIPLWSTSFVVPTSYVRKGFKKKKPIDEVIISEKLCLQHSKQAKIRIECYLIILLQAMDGAWYRDYSLRCEPVDYSTTPKAMRVSYLFFSLLGPNFARNQSSNHVLKYIGTFIIFGYFLYQRKNMTTLSLKIKAPALFVGLNSNFHQNTYFYVVC